MENCVCATFCHNEDKLKQKVKSRQEMTKHVHGLVMPHKQTIETHHSCHLRMGPVSMHYEVSLDKENIL